MSQNDIPPDFILNSINSFNKATKLKCQITTNVGKD